MFSSVNEMITAHRESQDSHYFDKDTMRFWDSSVRSELYDHGSGWQFFITSERTFDGKDVRFTIRKAKDLTIRTEGEFQQFGTLGQAQKFLEGRIGAAYA